MDMNSENTNYDESEIILLKAHKKKSQRQEHYLLREKAFRRKNPPKILSLNQFNDKADVSIDRDYSITEIIQKKNLHKSLMIALSELSEIEMQIIDECFFFSGSKRETYEKLGAKHNLTKQAYYSKLKKILRKLHKSIVNNLEEF